MQTFHFNEPFQLESGQILPELTVAFHTYGQLQPNSKVVWVCHALTANSDAADWWKGVIGTGEVINPEEYFIVCANIIGSCYGTTGPLSTDPRTGQPYFHHFPLITIRDMVQAHILLRRHLGISRIHLLMGGSMGGYQAMEWAVAEPEVIEQLFLLATSPTESAWGIAVHTTQRLAIETDATWKNDAPDAGAAGLKTARAIGMLTYRNYGIMVKHQTDPDHSKLEGFRASSYIHYQGEKLVKRFNAFSYFSLSRSMDSHNLARGRNADVDAVLRGIQQRTLIIGISSDILCPVEEQRFMQRQLPNASLIEIDSAYGHDGFMVEGKLISAELLKWLKNQY